MNDYMSSFLLFDSSFNCVFYFFTMDWIAILRRDALAVIRLCVFFVIRSSVVVKIHRMFISGHNAPLADADFCVIRKQRNHAIYVKEFSCSFY